MSLESFGLHHACGRMESAAGAAGPASFPLPGTETRWSRDREVDVKHIRIEVALDFPNRRIRGTVHHTVRPILDGLESLELDCSELRVKRVQLKGRRGNLKFTVAENRLRIEFPRPLSASRDAEIAIDYEGEPRRGLYFITPDPERPGVYEEAWSQGQDEDSRHWYPCYDYPNQKATTEVLATVPEHMQVLSNGRLVKKTRNRSKNTRTWHWKQAIPHVTYLVTLVAGEFETHTTKWRNVPLTVWAPKGRLADAKRACRKTRAMMDFFSSRIGLRYPYEKYDQVFVQDFIFGGMENTTATTLTDTALLDARSILDADMDSLVAHELAHQWWGDLVTCRDWSHGWLNEGFATYFDALFHEFDKGREEYEYLVLGLRNDYLAEDGGHYRRPIVCKEYQEPVEIFDRHLYQKGAVVLHMLRNLLGDDLWWRCISTYAQRHREGSVETVDLRRVVEDITGRNLEWFFDQWVFKGGHPALKATFSWDAKKKVATVTVKQTQKPEDNTSIFRMPLHLSFAMKGRRKDVTEEVELRTAEHSWRFELPARPEYVRFDPGFRVLKTLDFTPPRDMLVAQLLNDEDVAGRCHAAGCLGKDGSPEAVDALAKCLRSDAFWGVRAEAAKALAKANTAAARDHLLRARNTEHPKVRRAVVAALGGWLHDDRVGDALAKMLDAGDASCLVEAELCRALGRTRSDKAYDLLAHVFDTRDSWNDVVRSGVLGGLASLRDPRGVEQAMKAAEIGRTNNLRAMGALVMGRLAEVKDAPKADIVDRLLQLLEDDWLRTQITACMAVAELREDKALPVLAKMAANALDGRVKRTAAETATRIRKGRDRAEDVQKLGKQLEELRVEFRKLRDQVNAKD